MIYLFKLQRVNGCVTDIAINGVIPFQTKEDYEFFLRSYERQFNPKPKDWPVDKDFPRMFMGQIFEAPETLTEEEIHETLKFNPPDSVKEKIDPKENAFQSKKEYPGVTPQMAAAH